LLKRSILGAQVPVFGIAGDQQAALFGQGCVEPGSIKNTYGTGCFIVLNTGSKPRTCRGLITTLACGPSYALEGSVFIAGAAVQYLRDSLKIISTAAESEPLARSIDSNHGVYFVPAFVGLGAPYWDMQARGAIIGLTRGSGRAEIARAALESIAYQTRDVIDAMGVPIRSLRVDGGATRNNFLMQFQADILGCEIVRPKVIATTGMGAGFLAGVGAGLWTEPKISVDRVFKPRMSTAERERLYAGWREAVAKTLRPK
jgi:glycerol kinase